MVEHEQNAREGEREKRTGRKRRRRMWMFSWIDRTPFLLSRFLFFLRRRLPSRTEKEQANERTHNRDRREKKRFIIPMMIIRPPTWFELKGIDHLNKKNTAPFGFSEQRFTVALALFHKRLTLIHWTILATLDDDYSLRRIFRHVSSWTERERKRLVR